VRVLKFIDTSLKLIEEHSFLGVNRTLQELHVVNSNLEKFPREALQILGNLSLLSITGHRISILPGNSFGESAAAAKLEKLEISNGNHICNDNFIMLSTEDVILPIENCQIRADHLNISSISFLLSIFI